MSIQISVYEPPWKYLNIDLFKVFLKLTKKSPTAAMFRLRLRVPCKHNKQDFNRANEIFVRIQLIATEGSMYLFSDNRFDNLL